VVVLKVSNAVCLKPELLVDNCVSKMSSLHVVISHSDRDDEIYVEVVNNIRDQTKGNDQAGVLKVSQLDVHGPELNSPTDVGVLGWWWLESKRVPVR
jgi:hypothetical protein